MFLKLAYACKHFLSCASTPLLLIVPSCFRQPGTKEGLNETQHCTLLDGEMVIDKNPETDNLERRYLVYDVMMINTKPLTKVGVNLVTKVGSVLSDELHCCSMGCFKVNSFKILFCYDWCSCLSISGGS